VPEAPTRVGSGEGKPVKIINLHLTSQLQKNWT